MTIKDLLTEQHKEKLKEKEQGIVKLKELQAPKIIINNFQKEYDRAINKVNNGTYNPPLTYRDGLDKTILNTEIKQCDKLYTRNNNLKAILINNQFKINYQTRYCPIITKIVEE